MLVSMGDQCVCCGYSRCTEALEFHHRDSNEKDFGMGTIRANPKKMGGHCRGVLVCSLCHREIHAGIREVPTNATRFDESCSDYTGQKFSKVVDTCPVCRKSKDTSTTCSLSCAVYRGQIV